MTMVTFTVSLESTGEVVYKAPGTWRKWDLHAIGWARDGYTVIVDSGDVGPSSYTLSDAGWHQAGDPGLTRVEWLEAGPDIRLTYPDGSRAVYRFDGKTWRKPD